MNKKHLKKNTDNSLCDRLRELNKKTKKIEKNLDKLCEELDY